MRDDSPAKALAWMATGAAVLAAGALLGATAARKKEQDQSAFAPETSDEEIDDLEDHPPESASRRVETLAHSVERLEARVQAIERSSSAERVEAIWQRVLQLEAKFEQIRAQRADIPTADTIVAQAENRLAPRLHSLETRMDEHHAAIQQLQGHAAQTETNLQKMIVAVEKLTEQISRVLPGTRLEPRKEAPSPPPAERPAEAPAKPAGPFALRGR